jgi:hypothetical protein
MIDLEVNAKWVKDVAKHATFSGTHGGRIAMVIAVSMNRFDKLEEWAHEHMAPVYYSRSVWHTLVCYGVPFTYDHSLEDDEILIKESA